jgi:hypothetical protein
MSYYNEIDYGYDSDSTENTFVSNRQKVKNVLTDLQKEDKGCFQLKRKNLDRKMKAITVYSSGSQGTTIRNACTGERIIGYRVGSSDEDLLYSVIISSSEIPSRREPITLFFDSPEQYERHLFSTIHNVDKRIWIEKYLAAKRRVDTH